MDKDNYTIIKESPYTIIFGNKVYKSIENYVLVQRYIILCNIIVFWIKSRVTILYEKRFCCNGNVFFQTVLTMFTCSVLSLMSCPWTSVYKVFKHYMTAEKRDMTGRAHPTIHTIAHVLVTFSVFFLFFFFNSWP